MPLSGRETCESLDPIFEPDSLPEDLWYQEPLSPEQVEFLKTKARNSQSVMAKGGAPVQVQKTVTLETSKSQAPVVLPKKPANAGKEETSKSQQPFPPPENMAKAGKETVKSHPASPILKNMANTGKETAKSQSDQVPRVPSEKASATRLKWSDDAIANDKADTPSCLQRNEQTNTDGTNVETRIVYTLLEANEDGIQNTPPFEQPRRAELTRCCFQRFDYDQGASTHVWNEFLSKWATTNHKEEPWYIRVPADKDYLFFGEYGNDMETLFSMCPRGAHLHSEYVGGNGDSPRMLRIGVYLKVPTYGPMITKPAEERVNRGHEADMVSMFYALVDWSVRVTMGVECQFSTLLQSQIVRTAQHFANTLENAVATAIEHANVALASQARAEEAERSRQEAERKAEVQAAKERHAKKLLDETAHIEKSARDILESYQNDEVKFRRGLKSLITHTDDFIQDDAQRWTIIVTYISKNWQDKANWVSQLMWKQGYLHVRRT